MRSISGSFTKLVAVAATLTVSIAVPALIVQVGALDAVAGELATPASSGAQVVVATTEAKPVAVPHRVARHARPTTARPQQAVVRSQGPVAAQPRATRISEPVSVHTAEPPAAPSTPSTPSTPSSPTATTPTTTTTTPSTPSAPTTTTTTPPFTTTTTTPIPEPPITLPPPPKITVVTVPPPIGTDVFHDGNPVAVAITVKANIYAPPPSTDVVTPPVVP